VAVDSVGPYRILEKLGAGAMGVVYLAEDARLSRRVALKTVPDERGATPEARRKLLHEARMAARLTHPNVAAIYDIVESSESVHVVMEYVRGETLAARLRRGPLSVDEVTAVGIQLAEAAARAHTLGVIHRDLKLANVMLTPEGQVKILDFGLARARVDVRVADDSSSTGSGSQERRVAGTPGYMAPEAFLGHAPDARSDIYSLGVMLFELLTGRRPFTGSDLMAVGLAALTGPTPHVRDISPGLPGDLDAVIERAMARKPEDRYASAEELADALRAVAALAAAPTRSSFFRLPLVHTPASRRWWLAGAALLLIVAAVTARWSWPARNRTASSAVVAVLPLTNATGDAAGADLAVGIADVLISALGQVPGVTMVSRDATLVHKGREQSVAAIATALGADLVVDGLVQKSGGNVRISLSLLRPGSNLVAWSRTYDGAFADVFTLQNEAAAALSEALQVTLTPEQRRRIERPPTTNVEALAEYAQGRSFLERRDVAGNVERGITLLQSAVSKDPRFARAHASLGQAYWLRFRETRDESWADKALLQTTESLRLDPEDASARQALAMVYEGRGRKAEAIEELRRSISLQPGNDEAHSELGQLLSEQGRREEGIAELKRSISLRPQYWGHHYALGVALFDAGRYAEAAAAFRRVAELQPDSVRGFLMLGTTQHASGDLAAAIETFHKALAVAPDGAVYTNLGVALSAAGRHAEAASAFENAVRLAPRSPIHHRNLGDAYAKLGSAAMARKAYERAADLCRDELRTNPRDARVLSMLAVYEAKVGRHEDAARHATEAVALGGQMADVVYRRGVVQALAGRVNDSLATLAEAFRLGYSRQKASEDEDLAGVRGQPGFRGLLTEQPSTKQKGGGS
jgi:serine/threonine-protein kinase